MAEYRLAQGGVVRGTQFIPTDPKNRDHQRYQAWLAAGGAPDAIQEPTLADARTSANAEIDRQADRERAQHLPAVTSQGTVDLLRWDEAARASVDGSITAGEYLMLEAEIPGKGADVASVAAVVLAERTALATPLAAIESVRVAARTAIAAAATLTDVRNVVVGLTWPA